MPDYFVPLDTNKYTKYHRDIVNRGIMLQVTLRYLDRYRDELTKRYRNIEEFAAKFVVDEELLTSLRTAAEKENINPAGGEEEYERSLPMLSLQMKALLARDIWNTSEYMQIFNSEDENFKRALELVQTRDMNAVLRKEKKQ